MSVLAGIATRRGWNTHRLGALFERVQQVGSPKLQPLSVFLGDGVVPRSARDDNHNQLGADLSRYQRVQPGDIVFNKLRTWQGGFGVSNYEGIVSPAYIICRPRGAAADPYFIHHLLRSAPYLAELTRLSKWMPPSQFDIAWDEIRALPLSLPPVDEQRRIAHFLDDQVARIDKIITLRQRQIVSERQVFEHEREQLIEDGQRFTRRQLGQLTVAGRPINYGVLMPGPRLDVGVPLVEAGDVMRGPLALGELRLTDPAIEADFARSRLRGGDLVMAIRGSIGAVQIVPSVKGILNVTRDAARISLDLDVADARYVRHAMLTRRVREWFGVRVLGSAVTGINISDLRKVPISLPSRPEQQAIARKLEDDELRTVRVAELMSASVSQLQDLKWSLITASVTGEFDVSTAGGSGVPT